MSSVCDDIRAALSAFDSCTLTSEGAVVITHCLYPSATPVRVFVSRWGEGYKVHDGGGAEQSVWLHGRDTDGIEQQLAREAKKYGLEVLEGALSVQVPSADWLAACILSVANASSFAAHHVLERAAVAAESKLKERIYQTLRRVVAPDKIIKDYDLAGRSGKHHEFDFGVFSGGPHRMLINALTPAPASISFKYVAFADTDDGDPSLIRFAVHEQPIKTADVSLIQQVAELVPLVSLEAGTRRALIL